jgi:hypothetical protein
MADVPVGTITYVDLKSNFSTMRIKVKPGQSATKANVDTLATVIDTYSACDRQAHAVVDKTIAAATPAGNRDIKGVVTVMDENGNVHKYEIPGYNGEKEQDKEGDHMIDPDLAAIVAALATFTGYTFTVLRSPVIQKR